MGTEIDDLLSELVTEVDETVGVEESAIVWIKGEPDRVQAAVDAALAAGPLNAAQKQVFADLKKKLDDKQQEVISALSSNPGPEIHPLP